MRIIPSLLASLALSLAAACGGADSPTDTTPAPAEEPVEATPAADDQPATPVADESGGAAPAAGESGGAAPVDPATPISVAVQNLSKGQSGPGKKPAVATATSGTNQITVHLESFTHYCSPAPTFTAAVEGEKLVVTVSKPASAVSRCVAPHSLDAVVSLPGRNNVRSVSVVDASGKELASATVTSGK
jgi:hypothetical protein